MRIRRFITIASEYSIIKV